MRIVRRGGTRAALFNINELSKLSRNDMIFLCHFDQVSPANPWRNLALPGLVEMTGGGGQRAALSLKVRISLI